MDRTIINPMEQMRAFDFVSFEHDVLAALGWSSGDVQSNLPYTTVAGFDAVQSASPNLSITIGPGRIYQTAASDPTASGSIPQDLTNVIQQGINPGQTITLIPPSAGQSQWNLIQCQFSQVDAVRSGDPNGGSVPFYNAANPTQPISQSINTIRQGRAILQVVTGSAATTGSEIPPTPSVGWVPLYLVDLAGGQTQITTAQIKKSGPSVGTGVPSNYAGAPFLAGLLAQHHLGTPGHAPKINLGTEVTGVLPYANMAPVQQLLSGPLTLFVNAGATGNDSNNGLSAGSPFKTIQAALNSSYHNYNFNGFGLTVNVANGAYSNTGTDIPVIQCPGMPPSCAQINIVGNTASPGSVTLAATNAQCISCSRGGSVLISGFTVTATGGVSLGIARGIGLYVATAATVGFSNMVFGSCGYAQVIAQNGGNASAIGPISLTGSTTISFVGNTFGSVAIAGIAMTVTGLVVSTAFVVAGACGIVAAFSSTFVGTFTGQRYAVTTNGVIDVAGAGANYFPGTIAGAAGFGGQYV